MILTTISAPELARRPLDGESAQADQGV